MQTMMVRRFGTSAVLLATSAAAACRTSSTSSIRPTCYGFEDTKTGAKGMDYSIAAATSNAADPCEQPARYATFPADWRFKRGEAGTFAPTAIVASNSTL